MNKEHDVYLLAINSSAYDAPFTMEQKNETCPKLHHISATKVTESLNQQNNSKYQPIMTKRRMTISKADEIQQEQVLSKY